MKRKSQGCPLLACSDHTKDQIFFKDISYLDDGVEESEYVDKSFERWMWTAIQGVVRQFEVRTQQIQLETIRWLSYN